MKVSNMKQLFAKAVFYGVAAILVLWTGTLTYGFVSSVLPNMHWLVPLFALVVFDVGMLAWLVVFLDYAEGTPQRTISVALCLFDFAGVSLMVFAEVFMGGQELAEVPAMLGESALWGIAIWTVVNVLGVLGFHLTSPEARKSIKLKSLQDQVFDLAMLKLESKVDSMADKWANEQADNMIIEVAGMGNQRDGVKVIEHEQPALPASTTPQVDVVPVRNPKLSGQGVVNVISDLLQVPADNEDLQKVKQFVDLEKSDFVEDLNGNGETPKA